MSEYANYEGIFSQSIGLKAPWEIEKAKYDEQTHEVHIYIKARKTALM